MKILITDDNATNRAILTALVQHIGHSTVQAGDGQQAVEVFRQEKPDLVLMDITMPVMDGLEATKRIKAICAENHLWTPIILITAMDEVDDVVKGLEGGADDYMTKPVNSDILKAKILSMQRGLEWQTQLTSKSAELERYHYAAEEERRIAAHLMRGMIEAAGLHDPAIEVWLSPTEDCSGDLVAAGRTPGGALHVLIADGTGHGLAAAINVLPLPAIFYTMTSKGFGIGAIAAELNARIKVLLPTGRFIAATIASIDPRQMVVEIWNGGNPNAWLLGETGDVLHTWKSAHLPLGILPNDAFDSTTRSFSYSQGTQLVMMTDGLPEASNDQQQMYGMDRLLELLKVTDPAHRMTQLRQDIANHLGRLRAHDDISLILVNTLPLEQVEAEQPLEKKPFSIETKGYWRISLHLGAYQLKNIDTVPFTLDTLKRLQVNGSHLGSLFLIISELFNNALDHGILRLDSAIKNGPDGFDCYLEERGKRLNNLSESASLEIDFEHLSTSENNFLRIRVKDSGEGFDYQNVLSNLEDAHAKHGRGIALVRKLTENMQFNAQGNEIITDYPM